MPDLPERLGPYRLIRHLGEGGMGVVYLAYDEALGRRVALKVVRQATPTLVARLEREAHLQARVEHPAVCRLYHVGSHEGQPYLVLQYIEGTTLTEGLREAPLEARVRVFITLAEAIHAAHRQGLIHRDLKPSNLMVARDDRGAYLPYVMDFGLAREDTEGTLTEVGMILGSPAYMAPEQIVGAWLDPRTDIYGLGAAFFEVLAGRAPFVGATSAELLSRVQTQEPPTMGSLGAQVPRDLETILQTCLAKDPARRYPSAAALAEDLRRCLEGRPIAARRASWLERTLRRARRNRMAASLLVSLVFLLLGSATMGIVLQQRAQTQAYWAQRFGQEVLRMDETLRFGRMLPAHDVVRELTQVRRRMASVRHEMMKACVRRGPGHFALGEGHLILGELELARQELDAAWKARFRPAEVSLALGRCMAMQYQNARAATMGMLDQPARLAKQQALRQTLLQPAVAHLERARKELGSLTLEDQARLALAQEHFDEGAELAGRAYDAEPWRYDALFLMAKGRALRGRERLGTGHTKEGLAHLEEALTIVERLKHIAPSDDRLWEVEKFVWQVGTPVKLRGTTTMEGQLRAVAAAEHTFALNSSRVDMLHTVALGYGQLGVELAAAKRDPEPLFAKAEALMRRVLEGSMPRDVRGKALERLANLDFRRASYALSQHRPVEPWVVRGLAYCQQALAEGLAQWETHQNIAFLEMARADDLEQRRADATAPLARAVAALHACASLNPSAESHTNLAELANRLANARMTKGQHPAEALEVSRQAIQNALVVRPEDVNALGLEGDRCRLASGLAEDPRPLLLQGAQQLAHAVTLAPDMAWLHASRCQVHALLATARRQRGEDPTADITQARASGARALALAVEDPGPVRAILSRLPR